MCIPEKQQVFPSLQSLFPSEKDAFPAFGNTSSLPPKAFCDLKKHKDCYQGMGSRLCILACLFNSQCSMLDKNPDYASFPVQGFMRVGNSCCVAPQNRALSWVFYCTFSV